MPRLPKSAQTDHRCPELPNLKNSIGYFFLEHPVLKCYKMGSWIYNLVLFWCFFHWPSTQPWVSVESYGDAGIEDASELHLRLQEVDNDQDAVKMNTQRDVKITMPSKYLNLGHLRATFLVCLNLEDSRILCFESLQKTSEWHFANPAIFATKMTWKDKQFSSPAKNNLEQQFAKFTKKKWSGTTICKSKV